MRRLARRRLGTSTARAGLRALAGIAQTAEEAPLGAAAEDVPGTKGLAAGLARLAMRAAPSRRA